MGALKPLLSTHVTLLLATLSLMACSPDPSSPSPSTLGALHFVRVPDTLRCGDSSAVIETLDRHGGYVLAPHGTWSSSDTTVLKVLGAHTLDGVGEEVMLRAQAVGVAQLKFAIGTQTIERRIVIERGLVTAIRFDADSLRLPVGTTQRVGWSVLTSHGAVNVPVTLTIHDSSVVHVTPEGLVTALRPGLTWIRASVDSSLSDLQVLVPNVPPWSMEVDAPPLKAKLGRLAAFRIELRDALGSLPAHNTDRLAPRDTDMAFADGDGRGWATVVGRKVGRTELVFSSEGREVLAVALEVTPNPAARLEVTPSTISIPMTGWAQPTVNVYDAEGVSVSRDVKWRSLDPSIASVGDYGDIRGVSTGQTIVEVSVDSIVRRIDVKVGPPPLVTTIAASPSALTLVEGQQQQIAASGFNIRSERQPDSLLTWTSQDSAIATVDAHGRITAIAEGSTVVLITSGQTSMAVGVRIVPLAPSGPFKVDVRFAGEVPSDVESAFRRAAARWSAEVLADVPDTRVSLKAGDCDGLTTPLNELVDDVVIIVTVRSLPAGALAGAGTCWSRTGSDLPLVGAVTVNANSLAFLRRGNMLDGIALHEVGHGLGLNAGVWSARGLLAAGSPTLFTYVGAHATTGFAMYGGSPASFGGVPLEDVGGPGTEGTHWRSSVLRPELMTGFFSENEFRPLSFVTLGAWADLGYQVSLTMADDFAPTLRSLRFDAPVASPLVEERVRLRGRIGRDGTKVLVRH